MSKKKDIGRHYEPRLRALRESYEILDWASPVTQEARFAVLADNVDLPGKSLLDVGCGLGDLWAYLRRRRVEVEYLGVDILEKMVAAARQRHPEARFEQADIFGADTYEPAAFDVVFCSGAFNLNLGNNLGGVLDRIGSTIGDNGESVFGRAQYKVINSINDSVCVLVVANSHPHPTTCVVQGASFRTP